MVSAPPAPNMVVEIEEPIVAELFSADRLEQHAESLAAAQAVASEAEGGQSLIERTEENARSLLEYYRATARALQREQIITPAEQWLVENFYIVEDQLREIRDDLPIGYYRRLPKLASGHLAGYPRVYGIAWAFVAHTDSRLDPHVFRRFINAYQRVQPLSMGELWAVAITLRIVLVENLRRLAGRIVFSRQARHQADQLADALLGTGGQSALSPAAALRQFEKKPLDRAFAVQLIQRLRDLDPKVGPILLWLDERLAAQGTTADDIVRAEHQQQAAMSVTVRNVITSMRWTSAFDWHTFFENISLIDQTLRNGSNFGEMDFGTRDAYRHAIEDLSRGSERSELEIAELVVRHSKDTASRGCRSRSPALSRDVLRSRLLPHRAGTPRFRTRDWISRVKKARIPSLVHARGCARISWDDRTLYRGDSGLSGGPFSTAGSGHSRHYRFRSARRRSRFRTGNCRDQ